MTPDQINLVKTSFAKVVPIASDAAAIFYARLFETNPEFRPMFKSDLVEQGDKLMKMLATAVNGLDRLDDILPAVRALAARHVGYGVAPEHYGAVGAALLWTLGQGLGPEFTPEAEEAWAATYETLSSAMIEAGPRPNSAREERNDGTQGRPAAAGGDRQRHGAGPRPRPAVRVRARQV